MVATAVDYTNHFWGQKHHGYHVLYENLKHEEESVQELAQFVKERATYEEEWNKFLNKCIAKTSGLVAPNSMFSNAWLVTKNTMELLTEIQASFYITLQHLLKDVFKYHDDFVRSRKRMKEQDVVDAVNLMQTTTTCLQKSKETYAQRVNELERLKKENAAPKDISKAENKLNKSYDEYKGYVDKYGRVRADFEEKMIKATRLFQAHDQAFLLQMKAFMAVFARALDESASATSQVCALYRDSVDNLDIDGMLIKFVETKGTGKDRPELAVFEEIDIAKDINTPLVLAPCSLDLLTAVQKSAPVNGDLSAACNLMTLDTNTFDSYETNALKVQPSPVASDSSSSTAANIGPGSLPFSASLGRQKLSLWLPGKRKKYASQSSLSAAESTHQEFSHSQSESLGFLKKYRSKHKKSNTDITASNIDGPANEDSKSTASSSKSEEKPFVTTNGSLNIYAPVTVPPPHPTVPPPGDNDDEGAGDNFGRSRWSSCTESSDDDEDLRQAAKLRHINIKPLSESKANITASVDELRDAIGNIVLHSTTFSRSSTFDCDPWSSTRRSAPFNTGVEGIVRPLRAALTGDDHIRKKHLDSYNSSLPFSFSISGSNTVRARPHSSSTPTPGVSNLTLQTCENASVQHSTQMDSMESEQAFSQGESALFLEHSTATETPFTMSTSNSLSTTTTITENRIPVAMAINEYIHAWFRGTDPTKTTVRVFGSVLVSFPATVVSALTDLTSDIDPLILTLKNADKIKTISSNNQLISQVIDAFAAPYTFKFEKTQLAKWLSTRMVEKPDSQFFSAEVLTYEVKEPTIPPLILIVYWKLEAYNTDLRIDYRLNMDSSINCSLVNVIFTTKVEGSVVSVIADPNAEWSPSNNTLSWKLAGLSRDGECSGSLKARLSLSSGPATASQTFVQFQTSNVTISGADITITSDDLYHLSMVRRNVFSGKYFCDAEICS